MSRVYKKILSIFGLALVVGATIFAAGLPPTQDVSAAATSSDIKISVTINSVGFDAQIIAPEDDSVFFDVANEQATIEYSDASLLNVDLTYPDGTTANIYTNSSISPSGTIFVPLPLTVYGEYTLHVSGKDTQGNNVDGDAIVFSFHAITVDNNSDGTIRVNFGSATCRLKIEVFDVNDASRTNALITYNIDDLTVFPGYPHYADIEIPGFAALDPNGAYSVIVSAYDCSAGDTPLEQQGTIIDGIINPPDTGSISVFGLTISQTDYMVTGVVVFTAVVIFAFFLLRRRKSER